MSTAAAALLLSRRLVVARRLGPHPATTTTTTSLHRNLIPSTCTVAAASLFTSAAARLTAAVVAGGGSKAFDYVSLATTYNNNNININNYLSCHSERTTVRWSSSSSSSSFVTNDDESIEAYAATAATPTTTTTRDNGNGDHGANGGYYRRIPTRHSRHKPPPMCLPQDLEALTRELLDPPRGTLYEYQFLQKPPRLTKQDVFRRELKLYKETLYEYALKHNEKISTMSNNDKSDDEQQKQQSQYVERYTEQETMTFCDRKIREWTAKYWRDQAGKPDPPDHTVNMEQDAGWKAADAVIQKCEFVLNGYAATIPGSILHRATKGKYEKQVVAVNGANDDDANARHFNLPLDVEDRISIMKDLVERMEKEAATYKEMYVRLQSQMVEQEEQQKGEEASEGGREGAAAAGEFMTNEDNKMNYHGYNNDEAEEEKMMNRQGGGGRRHEESEEEEQEGEEQQPALQLEQFAPPGPTVAMFDTLLDVMAVHPTADFATEVVDLVDLMWTRHLEDGGDSENTNGYTAPTKLTFNAALRGVASMEYEYDPNDPEKNKNNERLRDDALYAAFSVFRIMQPHRRNSATYKYILQVVSKFFPPSRTRGNIAFGLWYKATEERVVDEGVLEALRQAFTPSNGEDYDKWFQEQIVGAKVKGQGKKKKKKKKQQQEEEEQEEPEQDVVVTKELPQKWGQYAKKLRHARKNAAY